MIFTIVIFLISCLIVFVILGHLLKNSVLIVGAAILMLIFGLYVIIGGISYYNGTVTINTTSMFNASSNITTIRSLKTPTPYNVDPWIDTVIGFVSLLAGVAQLYNPLVRRN